MDCLSSKLLQVVVPSFFQITQRAAYLIVTGSLCFSQILLFSFLKILINETVFHTLYVNLSYNCLLYTSDAADERSSVDLGGRRIIKKKKQQEYAGCRSIQNNESQNTK